MNATRLLTIIVAVACAISAIAAETTSPSADTQLSPYVPTPPAARFDLNLSPGYSSSQLGLKPQSERARTGMALPYGLNYNEESKILLMPIDQKSEWGLGVNLDLSPPRPIELAPASSPLGLQPKRAPGVMLQRRF